MSCILQCESVQYRRNLRRDNPVCGRFQFEDRHGTLRRSGHLWIYTATPARVVVGEMTIFLTAAVRNFTRFLEPKDDEIRSQLAGVVGENSRYRRFRFTIKFKATHTPASNPSALFETGSLRSCGQSNRFCRASACWCIAFKGRRDYQESIIAEKRTTDGFNEDGIFLKKDRHE